MEKNEKNSSSYVSDWNGVLSIDFLEYAHDAWQESEKAKDLLTIETVPINSVNYL